MSRILQYTVSALLVISFVALIVKHSSDFLAVLENVSVLELLILSTPLIIIFLITSIRFDLILRENFGIKVDSFDIYSLPYVSHLFSYIFPIKGGLVYTTFLLKKIYHLSYSSSISSQIIVYVYTFFTIGVMGLGLSIFYHDWRLISLSCLLAAMPFVLKRMSEIITKCVQIRKNKDLLLVQSHFESISTINRFTSKLVLLSLVKISFEVLWFYCVFVVTQLDFSPYLIILYTIARNLSLIINFVPGNLGVNELFGGAVALLEGSNFIEGVTIMLIIRVVALGLSSTCGFIALVYLQVKYKLL